MSFRSYIRGRAISKALLNTLSISANPIRGKTQNYTVTAENKNNVVTLDGTVTVTIPSGIFEAGDRIDFVNIGTGVVTFAGSGVTINSVDSAVTIDTQWAAATFLFTSSTAGVLIGKLA